jgi:hypothetical protein
MPDTVGLEQHEPTSLRGIALRAQVCKDHRFRDLYRCLDGQLLHRCWRELNKRAASGVDDVREVEGGLTPDNREAARACGLCTVTRSSRRRVQPRNRMRENRTSGSVRGAPGNRRSYRERQLD